MGTPYYVSPEVVRGAGYDWKSDVWSMGCLLYELALLRSPFEMEGANLYDVFQKISKGEFPPLPADAFSGPLRSLVARMLQIDPAKRPELEEVRRARARAFLLCGGEECVCLGVGEWRPAVWVGDAGPCPRSRWQLAQPPSASTDGMCTFPRPLGT